MALFAVDIGNTSTDVVFFGDGGLRHRHSFPSQAEGMQAVCEFYEKENQGEAVIIASVVPALSDLLSTRIDGLIDPPPILVENFKTELLPLRVDNPSTVGVDRIVNCVGAIHFYGCPAIVVSLGTATTFEVISEQGAYIGGLILPGVHISLHALTERAALLPPITLERPQSLLGTNTVTQMVSGIYYGTVASIEGIVERLRLQVKSHATVIGTGGLSGAISSEGIFDYHEPELTLKGLDVIYRNYCMNKG